MSATSEIRKQLGAGLSRGGNEMRPLSDFIVKYVTPPKPVDLKQFELLLEAYIKSAGTVIL